jgi:hypothetical protein
MEPGLLPLASPSLGSDGSCLCRDFEKFCSFPEVQLLSQAPFPSGMVQTSPMAGPGLATATPTLPHRGIRFLPMLPSQWLQGR